MRKRKYWLAFGVWGLLVLGLIGCFRPVIPFQSTPNYPVDVFYEGERPNRPYIELQKLEIKEERPLVGPQKTNPDGRMVARGNNMHQKELLLARLTLQAKRLGADALVNVRYIYYTTATLNGFTMEGMAAKYRQEEPVR